MSTLFPSYPMFHDYQIACRATNSWVRDYRFSANVGPYFYQSLNGDGGGSGVSPNGRWLLTKVWPSDRLGCGESLNGAFIGDARGNEIGWSYPFHNGSRAD